MPPPTPSPIATAFVRIRPSLRPDDRGTLEELSRAARALADGVDTFLANFAHEEPEPTARLRLDKGDS